MKNALWIIAIGTTINAGVNTFEVCRGKLYQIKGKVKSNNSKLIHSYYYVVRQRSWDIRADKISELVREGLKNDPTVSKVYKNTNIDCIVSDIRRVD